MLVYFHIQETFFTLRIRDLPRRMFNINHEYFFSTNIISTGLIHVSAISALCLTSWYLVMKFLRSCWKLIYGNSHSITTNYICFLLLPLEFPSMFFDFFINIYPDTWNSILIQTCPCFHLSVLFIICWVGTAFSFIPCCVICLVFVYLYRNLISH